MLGRRGALLCGLGWCLLRRGVRLAMVILLFVGSAFFGVAIVWCKGVRCLKPVLEVIAEESQRGGSVTGRLVVVWRWLF